MYLSQTGINIALLPTYNQGKIVKQPEADDAVNSSIETSFHHFPNYFRDKISIQKHVHPLIEE